MVSKSTAKNRKEKDETTGRYACKPKLVTEHVNRHISDKGKKLTSVTTRGVRNLSGGGSGT